MSQARSAARREQKREKLQDKQNRNRLHRQAQASMFDDSGTVKEEYLNALTEQGLEDNTARLMENVLTRDFILSKIQEAEKVEMKWLVRVMKLKIVNMHPRRESHISGKKRMAYYDDVEAGLTSLNQRQRQLIDQAVWDIFFRVARSVDGWQQEELSTQYNVSRMEDDEEGSGSRFGGLFS